MAIAVAVAIGVTVGVAVRMAIRVSVGAVAADRVDMAVAVHNATGGNTVDNRSRDYLTGNRVSANGGLLGRGLGRGIDLVGEDARLGDAVAHTTGTRVHFKAEKAILRIVATERTASRAGI